MAAGFTLRHVGMGTGRAAILATPALAEEAQRPMLVLVWAALAHPSAIARRGRKTGRSPFFVHATVD
jgi:hypothetical protein